MNKIKTNESIGSIGIIGHGFVGKAISTTLKNIGIHTRIYDKFKQEHNNPDILKQTQICFICVNTPAMENTPRGASDDQCPDSFNGYDLTSIYDVMNVLKHIKYQGIIVIKSTILPNTISKLSEMHPWAKERLVHNPEFLTARTAISDFQSQKHIVLGANDPDGLSLIKVK